MLRYKTPAFAAALSLALLAPTFADAQTRGRQDPVPDRRTPSAAETLTGARGAVAAAGVACEVSEARWLGRNASNDTTLYEVACQTGPGFLINDGEPPQVLNCLAGAASAAMLRAEDPDAQVGAQCELAANADAIAALTPAARAASISCTIDEAAWIGRTTGGQDRYEIGCAGADGYWMETTQNTLEPTRVLTCFEVVQAGATCRMTTAEEQIASAAAMAAPANRACDATAARFAGHNENGRFYELACAEGAGFMFRTDTAGAFQEAYDCVDAQRIGGGCTLTDASVITAGAQEAERARMAQAGLTCDYRAHRTVGADNLGRTVTEYECADQPLGLVAFIGDDPAQSASMDCISSELLSVTCSLTGKSTVAEALTRMMAAGGHSCTVVDFDVLSPAARASRGEAVEVKCADGSGYLVEAPADRQRTGQVRSCAQAREFGESCNL